MKKLLIMFLLGTLSLSAQTKISVRGVTLTYNKAKNTMVLVIPERTMTVIDRDIDVRVRVGKDFILEMTFNGESQISYNEFFLHEGHIYDGLWNYMTIRHSDCKEVKMNHIYLFTHVRPAEYLLEVTDLCDSKWESNEQQKTLIVN